LEIAAALGDRAGMNESRHRWYVAMARAARADGDPAGALRLLDQAEQLYRPGFYPHVRPIAAIKARIWIAQGRLAEAADWARERGVSVTDEARYLSEFDHLTLVRLLLAQHRAGQDPGALDQVTDLLDRLSTAAQSAERAGSLLEIRMLRALTQDAQGHRPQARDTLAEAFAQAPEPEHYARLFRDEGAALLNLLPGAEPSGGPRTETHAAETLSDRELQVLRLLNSELTGPEIARQLFVSHNTVRTHTKHIFTKLDVTNRRAAVRRARERGLI